MARQRKAKRDLAEILGVTQHTAGTRIRGKVPFNAVEMSLVSLWLGVDLDVLIQRAEEARKAAA